MAYAYPADGQSPSSPFRKLTDQDNDIVNEFKRKIMEDEQYINYFNERIKIEQTYIDQLQKLHNKTVGTDSVHYDVSRRDSKSTVRRAWGEVCDYTQSEILARQGYVLALKESVVAPLVDVKETQSRIRSRIREDLKDATRSYEDYAEYRIPKLHKAYFKASAALEEHKKQEAAVAYQQKLLSEQTPVSPAPDVRQHPFSSPPMGSPSSPGNPLYGNTAAGASSSGLSINSTTTDATLTSQYPATLPVPSATAADGSSLQRRGTLSGRTGRARASSGSGSTVSTNFGAIDAKSREVLGDMAFHSKKGINALMQRFGGDRDGDNWSMSATEPQASHRRVTSSGSGRPSTSPVVKGARLKREADEADKAYRAGVFDCESFRIRRERLQLSALTSLGSFNDDLNNALMASMTAFVSETLVTAERLKGATTSVSSQISAIDQEADSMLFRSRIPPLPRSPPILYDNFKEGPSRSLIFGVSLSNYDFARGEGGDRNRPPGIVEKCILWIDAVGLEVEGIYRVSGRSAAVREMVTLIEKNEEDFLFSNKYDIHSIAAVLKQYLRELPENDPLFPLPLAERIKWTADREEHLLNGFSSIRNRFRRLPPIHQTTFREIIQHLGRVASRSAINKMDAKNLALVFNSVVFGPDPPPIVPVNGGPIIIQTGKDAVLEDIITHADVFFAPPELPSRPSGNNLSSGGGSKRASMDLLPGVSAPTSLAFSPKAPSVDVLPGPTLPDVSLFTPDSDLTHLFSPFKIPLSMRQSVGDDLHVRPLASDDFMRSFFGLLATLSTSPPLAPTVFATLFHDLKTSQDTYYVVVIVDKTTDQIVASGTLLVERKFIHSAGIAGHIEDIVVSSSLQGRGVGLKLVTGLRDMATSLGCYKTILDCREDKVPFYEKCGFTLRGRQMAYYTDTATNEHGHQPTAKDSSGAVPSLVLEPMGPLIPDTDLPGRTTSALADYHTAADVESVADTFTSDSTTDEGVTYRFPTQTGPMRHPIE